MMLPLLLSVPHAGLIIPPEAEEYCVLTAQQVTEETDEGAAEIYLPLKNKVHSLLSTDIARVIIDLNRAETDRRYNGVVKTHTGWNVPVYDPFLSEEIIAVLLEKYYRPYHRSLHQMSADNLVLGVDCHTMLAVGPPIGPMAGKERPAICLSNADGTCPQEWLSSLAICFKQSFGRDVSINHPFTGGYIIRHHSGKMPWVQLEISRAPFMSDKDKSQCVLQALADWCRMAIKFK